MIDKLLNINLEKSAVVFRLLIGSWLVLISLVELPFGSQIFQEPSFNYALNNQLTQIIRAHYMSFQLLLLLLNILFLVGFGGIYFKAIHLLMVFLSYNLTLLDNDWSDDILIYMLMLFLWTDSGKKYTLGNLNYPFPKYISNLAVFGLIFHFIYIYIANFVHKMQNFHWIHGDGIKMSLLSTRELDYFNIGTALLEYSSFLTLTNYPLLIIQGAVFLALVNVRVFRNIWFISAVLMHLMMASIFGIPYFSLLMMSYILWIYLTIRGIYLEKKK